MQLRMLLHKAINFQKNRSKKKHDSLHQMKVRQEVINPISYLKTHRHTYSQLKMHLLVIGWFLQARKANSCSHQSQKDVLMKGNTAIQLWSQSRWELGVKCAGPYKFLCPKSLDLMFTKIVLTAFLQLHQVGKYQMGTDHLPLLSGSNYDRFRHWKADSHAHQKDQPAFLQHSSDEDRLHSCQVGWWLSRNRLEATAHPNWPSACVFKQGSLCMLFSCLLGSYELLFHLKKTQVKINAHHFLNQFNIMTSVCTYRPQGPVQSNEFKH